MTRNTAAKRESSEKKVKNMRVNILCMWTKVSIEKRRGSKVEKGNFFHVLGEYRGLDGVKSSLMACSLVVIKETTYRTRKDVVS